MTTKAKKRKAARAAVMTRTAKPVKLDSPWDHGATGPANRVNLVIEERGEIDPETGKMVNVNGVTGVRRVDLLEFWHKEGRISTNAYNAATALRDAFEATQRGKPALPDNDRVQSSPKPDHAVTIQIDRISRYQAIARHIEREDRAILSACVLDGQHPAKVAGALNWVAGMQHLAAALDRLADKLSRNTK